MPQQDAFTHPAARGGNGSLFFLMNEQPADRRKREYCPKNKANDIGRHFHFLHIATIAETKFRSAEIMP